MIIILSFWSCMLELQVWCDSITDLSFKLRNMEHGVDLRSRRQQQLIMSGWVGGGGVLGNRHTL
ncbi:hypothetical protein ACOSQ2_029369 [Xanthoceras sorbifolium]